MRTVLILIVLAGCGSASTSSPRRPPGSRGLRADAHLDAAREHERRTEELARWPDARNRGTFDAPSGGLWFRAWGETTPAEHARLVETHRSQAAQLQAAYDEACRDVEQPAISPLRRYAIGGTPTPDGMIAFLSPDAGPPDRLRAAIQCHRASMMLGQADMDDCPLDLAGIKVEAYGDATGISVELKLLDRDLVPELQRRAARELELAGQRRNAPTE